MAKFTLQELDKEKDYKKWISFLKEANGATIFHNPNFLSYHKDKFNDKHLGVYKGENLIGVLSYAIFNEDGKVVLKSPYGASYGGFIFKDIITYSQSKEIVQLFINYCKELRVDEIRVTPSLGIYYKKFSDTFTFSLLENGFRIVNSDISSVVILKAEDDIEGRVFTSKIRNIARKAKKLGVEIKFNDEIDKFWFLLEKTYARHQKLPTHTKEEFYYLMEKFPNKIYCNVAYFNKIPVAGMGVFEVNNRVLMSFYLANDEEYKQTQALSLVVYETLLKAKEANYDYFDFGTSSLNMVGNENVFKFKEQFGAIGVFRHSYKYKG